MKRGRSCGALPMTTTASLGLPRSNSPIRKEATKLRTDCSLRPGLKLRLKGPWLQRTNLWRRITRPQTGAERLTKRADRIEFYVSDPLCQVAPAGMPPSPSCRGLLLRCCEVMTSDTSLSLILRRLDEVESKLDRMLQELRMPTAIGYSVRRGNLPRKD